MFVRSKKTKILKYVHKRLLKKTLVRKMKQIQFAIKQNKNEKQKFS